MEQVEEEYQKNIEAGRTVHEAKGETNKPFVQEAVALENGNFHVSVHRGQRVKSLHEGRR